MKSGRLGIWLHEGLTVRHCQYSCRYDSPTWRCSACSARSPCSPAPTAPGTPRSSSCATRALEDRLHLLRHQLLDAARHLAGAKVLAARLYGVGPVTALAMTCWLAGEDRFSSARKAVRFAGLDVTVSSSDRKGPPGRLSRQGPPVLRWAVYEAGRCRPWPDKGQADGPIRLSDRIPACGDTQSIITSPGQRPCPADLRKAGCSWPRPRPSRLVTPRRKATRGSRPSLAWHESAPGAGLRAAAVPGVFGGVGLRRPRGAASRSAAACDSPCARRCRPAWCHRAQHARRHHAYAASSRSTQLNNPPSAFSCLARNLAIVA